jgi:hypothetical protein
VLAAAQAALRVRHRARAVRRVPVQCLALHLVLAQVEQAVQAVAPQNKLLSPTRPVKGRSAIFNKIENGFVGDSNANEAACFNTTLGADCRSK